MHYRNSTKISVSEGIVSRIWHPNESFQKLLPSRVAIDIEREELVELKVPRKMKYSQLWWAPNKDKYLELELFLVQIELPNKDFKVP